MQLPYHSVILSNAKDLNTSTSAFQILHFVQNDTTKRKWMCIRHTHFSFQNTMSGFTSLFSLSASSFNSVPSEA